MFCSIRHCPPQFTESRDGSNVPRLRDSRLWGAGFRVQSLGFRVQGLGFKVWALGSRFGDVWGIGCASHSCSRQKRVSGLVVLPGY